MSVSVNISAGADVSAPSPADTGLRTPIAC
jgi:hypothetical protein